MEIRTSHAQDGIAVIALEGEMDLYNAKDLKDAVNVFLEGSDRGLIIDLQDLEYIDSSGISALLYTFTQSKARQKSLCFVNIKGSVKKVIELTSLSGFFPIADSLDDAVKRLQANS